MEAVVIDDLTKYYGRILALDGLSLTVEDGMCVGLLGPNGAGKTTTFKILCRLIKPSSGSAYIYDEDVTSGGCGILRYVGAIIETPEFYPYLTPEETLAYLGRLRGMGGNLLRERIREVLDLVGLLEWGRVKVGRFSRGMKQRLSIAQAILHDPPLLILDEPMMGLDPRGMYEVRELIRTLNRHGRTVLLSSHLIHEVAQLCDAVALINRGRLLTYDETKNVEKYLQKQTIIVDVLRPPTRRQLDAILELGFVRSVVPEGSRLRIEVEGGYEVQAQLLDFLVREVGLYVVSFRSSTEGLEELYLQFVGDEQRWR